MSGIRNSACTDDLESKQTGGKNNTKRADDNAAERELQATKGNKCGHNRNKIKEPLFYGTTSPKINRPHSIKSACDRIGELLRIRSLTRRERKALLQGTDKDARTAQGVLSLFSDYRLARLFNHESDTGEFRRRRRSESIEAAAGCTLRALLYHTDLYTMAYGFRDENNHQRFFDFNKIVLETGISYSRIQRAMSLLQNLELITVKKVIETLDDGHIITKAVQIHLSPVIFEMLGLSNEFANDYRYAMIANDKKERLIRSKNAHIERSKPKISKQKECVKKQAKTVNPRAKQLQTSYSDLIAKGISPADAITMIKSRYHSPPH